MSLRAFGGGELIGDKLVKFAYLDESGVSKNEPNIIIAGVIVDAESQWRPVESRLGVLIEKYVRPERRSDASFHAKEIFHGNGKFPRDLYTEKERHRLLRDLCDIPKQLALPVVAAYVSREDLVAAHPGMNTHGISERGQALSSIICAGMVEYFMRIHGKEREIATLVFERSDKAVSMIREAHAWLKTQAAADEALDLGFTDVPLTVPYQHIPDAPYFQDKAGSCILQIADVCAFALQLHLRGVDKKGYYQRVAPALAYNPIRIPLPSASASSKELAS